MFSPEKEPGRIVKINTPEQIPPTNSFPTEDLSLHKPKSKPVEIFNAVRHFKPREYWHHLESRARPGALVTVATLDIAAGFVVLPTLESAAATAINTGMNTDPLLTIPTLVASIAGLTALSIRQEIRALKKERFSATTVGTLAFTVTGEPLISSVFNHAGNYFFDTLLLNPVTTFAIVTQNPQLVAESFAATPFATASWYAIVNTFIARGEVEKVLNPIKKAQHVTLDKIKHKR